MQNGKSECQMNRKLIKWKNSLVLAYSMNGQKSEIFLLKTKKTFTIPDIETNTE